MELLQQSNFFSENTFPDPGQPPCSQNETVTCHHDTFCLFIFFKPFLEECFDIHTSPTVVKQKQQIKRF